MTGHQRTNWLSVALSLTFVATPVLAQAAGSDFRIHKAYDSFPEAPDYQFNKYPRLPARPSAPTKWLRLEMDFDSEPAWADHVEVRWYIQVEVERKPVVFTASVLHSNVKRNPAGQRHITAVFMRPRTVDRYLRNERGIKKIAVQIFVNGKLEDTWPRDGKDRWWEATTPVNGFLVDVTQTPFYDAEGDRYEEVSNAK